MSSFILPPPPVASVAVAGETARFAVRRIFCVGRNYAAHAREMGMDDRDPPFFFTKPADAVVDSGSVIAYPKATADLHHEIELVAAIGSRTEDIGVADALSAVWGYAAGIDFTRRDLQIAARDVGRPWDLGKAFDQSAPCGPLVRAADAGPIDHGRIWLAVNGTVRQDGDLSEMIWTLPEVISILSKHFVLEPGDLIYSGTPAGIGPVVAGDRITGGVAGIGEIAIEVGAA